MKLTFPLTLLALCLVSCSSLFPTPPVTETPAPTATNTATIVWFPATNTPTGFSTPTVQPTEPYHSGVGELLFSDSFEQPSEWNTSISNFASALVERNRLLLSISGSGPISIASLRSQPPLLDFYAEATATINLCSGRDQYGMLFRAGEIYYRLSLNCSGQVRLDRGSAGSITPQSQWLTSGDVPIGPPASVTMGVWALGKDVRFYLNNHLQFSYRDPNPQAGRLGFFVYANSTQPVTVSFSDLSVYSVFQVSPTPSPTVTLTTTP